MVSGKLLERLEETSPAQITREELALLLGRAETVREENTSVSGMLRILKLGDLHFIQERTPNRSFLLRSRPTLEAAEAFVEKRLQTYEKMWDG